MVSILLPVAGSTRRQYFAPGAAAGALASWAGMGSVADAGEAATIIPKARTNSLCAMSFLPDWQRGFPESEISPGFDRRREGGTRDLTFC